MDSRKKVARDETVVPNDPFPEFDSPLPRSNWSVGRGWWEEKVVSLNLDSKITKAAAGYTMLPNLSYDIPMNKH